MDFHFENRPKTPPPLPPAPPIRTVSNNPKVTFKGPQTWRESVAMFMIMGLTIVLMISTMILLCYTWKEKQAYDYIVDFLDKTIQISKIAERPFLGIYQLSDKELEVLSSERTVGVITKFICTTNSKKDLAILTSELISSGPKLVSEIETNFPRIDSFYNLTRAFKTYSDFLDEENCCFYIELEKTYLMFGEKILLNPRVCLIHVFIKRDFKIASFQYKWFLRVYLFSEIGLFTFVLTTVFLYLCFDVSRGTTKVLFWMTIIFGLLCAVVPINIFTFSLITYSNKLPNATEKILNHAIPHNVGGIQQMEIGLGCTFDLNLYAANKRKLNPNNTCDPRIDSSFIPVSVLISILVIRLSPIVIGSILVAKKTPLSEGVAQFVEKIRKSEKRRLYIKKQQRMTTTFDNDRINTSTTFGVEGTPPRITSTPLPPVPSPAHMDHSISYNNAAYFATSGAFSSRSSDISRIDETELFKNPINRAPSGSLQSEV